MELVTSSDYFNVTLPDPDPSMILKNLHRVLYRYALPTICVFGSFGNILNLLILTGKRIQHSLRSMERSANVGLTALALSDLLFCLTAFPSTFLPQELDFEALGFLTYYGCYCAAVINVFIMTSTWLTVAMSVERYLAICHPLKSRQMITLRRTRVTIVVVFLVSGVFNLPVFWRYVIIRSSDDNATTAAYRVRPRTTDKTFDHAYRGLWSALGNFVPLLLLLSCNVALMKEIHHSYTLRREMNGNAGGGTAGRRIPSSPASHDQDASNRITVTLISIVVMFCLLVAPSELVKQIAYLIHGDLNGNYTYTVIEFITNLLQTINFSANFILYCIINPSFRKTMWKMMGFGMRRRLPLTRRSTNGSKKGFGSQVSRLRMKSTSFRDAKPSQSRINSVRRESVL